jgi:hypothetical protein
MAKQELYYDQAEKLFINGGHSLERIAEVLPVSAKTLYQWKKKGDWGNRKRAHLASHRNVGEILRQRLEDKIAEIDGRGFSPGDADEISKITASIARIERSDYDLKAASVEIMARFGKYLRKRGDIDAGELQQIGKYIQGFFEWLEING